MAEWNKKAVLPDLVAKKFRVSNFTTRWISFLIPLRLNDNMR